MFEKTTYTDRVKTLFSIFHMNGKSNTSRWCTNLETTKLATIIAYTEQESKC